MNIPQYMIPHLNNAQYLSPEYPKICNLYKNYKNPPLPIPKGPAIKEAGLEGTKLQFSAIRDAQAKRRFCIVLYHRCYWKYRARKTIEARSKAALTVKKITDIQNKLNNELNALRQQYQQLLQQYNALQNLHRQDLEELNLLNGQLERILNLLQAGGL